MNIVPERTEPFTVKLTKLIEHPSFEVVFQSTETAMKAFWLTPTDDGDYLALVEQELEADDFGSFNLVPWNDNTRPVAFINHQTKDVIFLKSAGLYRLLQGTLERKGYKPVAVDQLAQQAQAYLLATIPQQLEWTIDEINNSDMVTRLKAVIDQNVDATSGVINTEQLMTGIKNIQQNSQWDNTPWEECSPKVPIRWEWDDLLARAMKDADTQLSIRDYVLNAFTEINVTCSIDQLAAPKMDENPTFHRILWYVNSLNPDVLQTENVDTCGLYADETYWFTNHISAFAAIMIIKKFQAKGATTRFAEASRIYRAVSSQTTKQLKVNYVFFNNLGGVEKHTCLMDTTYVPKGVDDNLDYQPEFNQADILLNSSDLMNSVVVASTKVPDPQEQANIIAAFPDELGLPFTAITKVVAGNKVLYN